MRGDVIIVEDHHRRAAGVIVEALQSRVDSLGRPFTLTVAGESGSGKSEMGQALKEAFQSAGYPAVVLQQDDYFVLPPKSNDLRRRKDISWVGLEEVRIDELNGHLKAAKEGAKTLTKPLVIYEEDRITDEVISLAGIKVVIAEGTYTTLLDEADTRVFIARDFNDTLPARKRRAREQFDPFIEDVLKLEHRIIAPHRERAEIVITRDYDVEF
jgi:uridine kinase